MNAIASTCEFRAERHPLYFDVFVVVRDGVMVGADGTLTRNAENARQYDMLDTAECVARILNGDCDGSF